MFCQIFLISLKTCARAVVGKLHARGSPATSPRNPPPLYAAAHMACMVLDRGTSKFKFSADAAE